jgi:hypothetical protein
MHRQSKGTELAETETYFGSLHPVPSEANFGFRNMIF